MKNSTNISEYNNCFSEEILIKYLNDGLNESENALIESHLRSCEMCSDLLDGLILMDNPEELKQIQIDLNKEVDKLTGKKSANSFVFTKYRSIAAIAIILLMSGTFIIINRYISGDEYSSIAITENMDMVFEEEVSIEKTEDVASLSEETITKIDQENQNINKILLPNETERAIDQTKIVETPGATSQSQTRHTENISHNDFFNVNMNTATGGSSANTILVNKDIIAADESNDRDKNSSMGNSAARQESSTENNRRSQKELGKKEKQNSESPTKMDFDDDSRLIVVDEKTPMVVDDASAPLESMLLHDVDAEYSYEEEQSEIMTFTVVEEKPVFPGGDKALLDFIAQNTLYPQAAKDSAIQGKVYVMFVIDETGKVVNPQVIRGVHPLLDEEALRVVSQIPDWTPGRQRGKSVAVSFLIPINFKLF